MEYPAGRFGGEDPGSILLFFRLFRRTVGAHDAALFLEIVQDLLEHGADVGRLRRQGCGVEGPGLVGIGGDVIESSVAIELVVGGAGGATAAGAVFAPARIVVGELPGLGLIGLALEQGKDAAAVELTFIVGNAANI